MMLGRGYVEVHPSSIRSLVGNKRKAEISLPPVRPCMEKNASTNISVIKDLVITLTTE